MAEVSPELSDLWQPEGGQVFGRQGRRELVADARALADDLDPTMDPDTHYEFIRAAVIARLDLEATAATSRPGDTITEIEEV